MKRIEGAEHFKDPEDKFGIKVTIELRVHEDKARQKDEVFIAKRGLECYHKIAAVLENCDVDGQFRIRFPAEFHKYWKMKGWLRE